MYIYYYKDIHLITKTYISFTFIVATKVFLSKDSVVLWCGWVEISLMKYCVLGVNLHKKSNNKVIPPRI